MCLDAQFQTIYTSKSSTIDTDLMKLWFNTCLKESGPFLNRVKSLLILDDFTAYKKESIISLLKLNESEMVFFHPELPHL